MDAETRSQLESNSLAQALSDAPEFFRRYGTRIILGVAVVLAVFLFVRSRSQNAVIREQNQRAFTQNARAAVENLRALPVAFTDPAVRAGERATLMSQANDSIDRLIDEGDDLGRGEGLLARGDLYWALGRLPEETAAATRPELAPEVNRDDALDAAAASYTAVLSEAEGGGLAAQQRIAARFGLAAVAEERRNFDAADEQYAAVLEDENATPAARLAAEARRAMLDELRDEPPLPPPAVPATRPAG